MVNEWNWPAGFDDQQEQYYEVNYFQFSKMVVLIHIRRRSVRTDILIVYVKVLLQFDDIFILYINEILFTKIDVAKILSGLINLFGADIII